MYIFASLLIPIFTAIILLLFFKHKTLWWEFLIPIGVSLVIILIFKFAGEGFQTRDTEYWSDVVIESRYYEAWDEEVSCRHPIYEEQCSGSGENRTCYDVYVGDEHSYDVDDHPRHWRAYTKLGWTIGISQNEYNRLKIKFNNETFKNLNRDYHSYDGDMYFSIWDGSDEKLEYTVKEFTYENRIQASNSVFNYPEPDTTDIKNYKLFTKYPDIGISNSIPKQRHILGMDDKKAERKLEILNGRLGSKKQVRVFFMIFDNQPIRAGQLQQAMFGGGNKNEFIVAMSVDKDKNIQWCYPITWSENELLKIEVRNFVQQEQKKMDLSELVDFLYPKIEKDFVRREFAEFSYLKVEPSTSQIIWCLSLTLIVNIIISIFVISNRFDDNNPNGRNSYRRY
jgi:hypothetical protein